MIGLLPIRCLIIRCVDSDYLGLEVELIGFNELGKYVGRLNNGETVEGYERCFMPLDLQITSKGQA